MGVRVPEISVSAAGKDVEKMLDASLGCVSVDLDMDGESSASVELLGAYDIEKHSLDSRLLEGLKPGDRLEICLGYVEGKSKVFAGYIDGVELEANQDEAHVLRVFGSDVVKLMKENSHCRILTAKKHSDVFAAVLGAYSWTGTGVSADKTDPYDQAKHWYQNESDYEFVMRELVERCPGDREFYVSAGTAYYKKPDPSRTVMTIDSDTGIGRIRAVSRFEKRMVTVYGGSAGYETYTGRQEAEAGGISKSGGTGASAFVNPDADSQKLVDGMAKAAAARLERRARQIHITVEGNPALLAGAYVKIAELDGIWNGTYRIRRASHRCGEDGYQTEMTLEGS